jgi:hypothetical protein
VKLPAAARKASVTFLQTLAETFAQALGQTFAKARPSPRKENGNLLFLHELHEVAGAKEAAYRERWMPALALRDQWRSKLLRTSAWSPWH